MKLFYEIWVDCIVKLQSRPDNKNSWRFLSMTFMTMAMALNFLMLLLLLPQVFKFYYLDINIFPGKKLDALIAGFILFVLPPLCLNYFLIFRSNNYLMLIKKYTYRNGRLFMLYFFTSISIPLLFSIIVIVINYKR